MSQMARRGNIGKIAFLLQMMIQILSGAMILFVIGTIIFTRLDKSVAIYDFTNINFIEDYINNQWVALGAILILGIGWVICHICRNREFTHKDKAWKKQLFLAAMILLVVQICLVYNVYFLPGQDAENLYIGAQNFVEGRYDAFYNLGYYQISPNNLMIYILYIISFAIGKFVGFNGYVILLGMDIILSNIAVVLTALTVERLTNHKKTMWIAFVIAAGLFGLSPWISIPYTDALSIAGSIGCYYLYLVLRDKKIPEIIKWIGVIFPPLLLYLMKALNVIILIAIVISEILFLQRKKGEWRRCLLVFLAFLVSIGMVAMVKDGMMKFTGVWADQDKEMTMMWVLFYGSDETTYGQWSMENSDFMMQYSTQQERTQAMLSVIKERWTQMGWKGYLSHCMNKTHIFYGDGHFGWNTGFNFVRELPERTSKSAKVIRNICYPPESYGFVSNYSGYGNYFKFYSVIRQLIWFLVLIGMAIMMIMPSGDKKILILRTVWIGVFLFTMLFETHARLLLSVLPVFVVMAGVGLDKIYSKRV